MRNCQTPWDSCRVKRRALVVDDERLIAALVSQALAGAGFEVEVAHSAAAASEAFATFDPDVAVLDISLGRGASGLDLAHLAAQSYPGTALLLLTRYPDLRTAQISEKELPANCGFLSKTSVGDASVLLDAVEAALRETSLLAEGSPGEAGPLACLTRTQLQVLRLAAEGYTTSEIARRRNCTVSAVEKILGTVYQRLGIVAGGAIHPRVEAVRIYASSAVMPERFNES